MGRISGERERERRRGSGSQLTREDWMIDQAAAEQVKPFIIIIGLRREVCVYPRLRLKIEGSAHSILRLESRLCAN